MSHDTQLFPQDARGSLQEQIEGWLHMVLEAVERAGEQEGEACSPAKAGRPKSLSSKSLWLALLVGVLRGVRSQRAIWRLVTAGQGREPRQDLSDQAVYKRLEQEGWPPLARLFERISQVLAHWLEPALDTFRQQHGVLAPFASEVVALDEMHLDQVKRRLPILRHFQKGALQLLPGKLVALFDVRLQQWRAIDYLAQSNADGKQQARQLLNRVKKGALVLADLGYFGFEWLDGLTTQGLAWISRIREDTTVVVIHTYYQAGETFDRIVWLGARQTQARYAVRQVQFRQGGQLRQYVTNVCDPSVLSLPDIARLYARRWDIELAFLTLKRELGLHLIWSSKVTVVLLQVWAALIVAQVVQAIRMEVALRAGVDAFEVSLPLLVQNLSFWGASGRDGLTEWVRQGERLGIIRPASRLRTQAPEIASLDLLPLPAGTVLSRQPCSRLPKASRQPSSQQEEPVHPQRDQLVALLFQREERLKALRRLARPSSPPVASSVHASVARCCEPLTPVQPDPTFAQPGWAFLQPLVAAR